MWFIKFILVVLAIYIIGYLFFKFAIPWLFKRFMKKLAKRMNPNFVQEEKIKKDKGSMNIKYVPNQKKEHKLDNQQKDYIDFEDV